jgi:hypothetical protein
VYCFNFTQNHIHALDSNDYVMKSTDPVECHKHVFEKIPIIDATFQKVSNFKLPGSACGGSLSSKCLSKPAPTIAYFLSGST